MPTLKAVVEDVSGQLNDQEPGYEYTRWARKTLINYCTEAMSQVALYRPDAFTSLVPVTLVPGVRQMLPAGVSSLASVIDNDNSNNPLPVARDDQGLIRAFNKAPCVYTFDKFGNVTYRITAYSYDIRNPGYFFVSPPVPENMNPPATIGISGVVSPPTLSTADWLKDLPIDTKYLNPLLAWMLSKAYEIDTESESSFRNLNYQRNEFYRMMGIKYTQDSKYNSGSYLGQRGYDSNIKG